MLPHDFVREDTGHIFDDVSDDDLAVLVGKGDQKAFSELLNRFTNLMVTQIACIRPCGIDGDDLMQECSIGLLDAAVSYKRSGGASFRTYAGVCIDNRIRSAIRHNARDKNKPLTGYVELSDYYEKAGESADRMPDPAESIMIRESVTEMKRRIKGLLSIMEFKVFDLYLSGMPYGSIARVLDISEKSVDNAMQRIRRKLRREELHD